MVLEAIPEIKNKYTIIVNKTTPEILQQFEADPTLKTDIVKRILAPLKFQTNDIHFFTRKPQLVGKRNAQYKLPPVELKIILQAPKVKLDKSKVQPVNFQSFSALSEVMRMQTQFFEQMEKMKQEHQRMLAQLRVSQNFHFLCDRLRQEKITMSGTGPWMEGFSSDPGGNPEVNQCIVQQSYHIETGGGSFNWEDQTNRLIGWRFKPSNPTYNGAWSVTQGGLLSYKFQVTVKPSTLSGKRMPYHWEISLWVISTAKILV
eukprot:TRINITY_DN2360_c0_g1_i4.p1 TRINITY_DN2360_c0_g1~~TRINITY_DN2360_c0_g1_i4.p1  ORF type:complete len:260 (+),score=13.14 TRINITY_DN2360_c0_g1_i4:354-1133(+)